MKTLFLSLCSALFILTMAECEKNKDKPEISHLAHVKTIEGGCNIDLKSSTNTGNDTAIFTIYSDTLNIFVGVNYACCTPFSSSVYFRNDSILVDIEDICQSSDNCYCRCMCYYTWDFKVTGIDNDVYPYRINLNGALAESRPQRIQEGILTVTNDY